MKCKERHFGGTREEYASAATRNDFENKKPYDYLQLCYYQTNQLQQAANAAYTNYVYNQDNNIMKENLNFYMNHIDVNKARKWIKGTLVLLHLWINLIIQA